MVDGQPNAYTAAVLKRWKATHESKLFSDTEGPLTQSLFSSAPHPTALIDQHIDKDIQLLRKRRFHYGFDTAQSALTIATKLTNGDYSTGTADKRGRALAQANADLGLTGPSGIHCPEQFCGNPNRQRVRHFSER